MGTGPPHEGLGARCRCFFTLMVDAPGFFVSTSREPAVDIFSFDGGHSQISGTASQGAYRRRFLALMVDALGSPASPPRGPAVDVSKR
jgi:hypothetical protein